MQIQHAEFMLLASSISSQLSKANLDCPTFTEAMREGLLGEADDDEDGNVTIKELRRFMTWRLKELMNRFARIPGCANLEQDFVFDTSSSMSESIPLASALMGKRSRAISFELPVATRQAAAAGSSVMGKWKSKRGIMITAAHTGQLELTLTPTGLYQVTFTDAKGHVEKGSGRFRYARKLFGTRLWQWEGCPDNRGTDWRRAAHRNQGTMANRARFRERNSQ